MTITKCKSYDLIEVVAGLYKSRCEFGTGRQLICLKNFQQTMLVGGGCCCCFCFVCLLRVHAQEGSSSCPVSLSVML